VSLRSSSLYSNCRTVFAVCREVANTEQGARAVGHILHGCSSVSCVCGVKAWHLVFTNSGGSSAIRQHIERARVRLASQHHKQLVIITV